MFFLINPEEMGIFYMKNSVIDSKTKYGKNDSHFCESANICS